MIWRHELKYIIDEASFYQLYYTLSPVLLRDRHEAKDDPEGLGGYQIRSLYFDDMAKRSVFEKLAGTDPRHKFRIRIYHNQDEVIRLEKKIKYGAMTQKQSCSLTRHVTDSLIDGDIEPLFQALIGSGQQVDDNLAAQFYTEWQTRHLRPSLLVDYHRIPLIWPDGNVRITFDRFLATGFYRKDLWDPQAALKSVLEPQAVIMEVKYDHFLPSFISGLLDLQGAMPLSVSKYVQCAAFCRTQTWEDQG